MRPHVACSRLGPGAATRRRITTTPTRRIITTPTRTIITTPTRTIITPTTPPPPPASRRPRPRQFSYKHARQLLVSQHSSPRPQLPFLHPSAHPLAHGQILRLFSISANHKKFLKETARLSVRYSILIFLVTSCFSIASLGILSEQQERAFPSPHEWSLITRFRFRRGRWWQVPENNEDEGFPNWARVYSELDYALRRLEHPAKDGQGLVVQAGDGTLGFDVSAKSEEWRQGYHEVLMGMAAAAERLDGWVTDSWRRNVWAPEFVASPSNPRPKAVLPGMPEVPDEEHRVPAAAAPETFYMKIITTKGFTTRQRLAAALAYADWLSFRKLPDSAEQMYRRALDIAISGLSTPDPTAVIDPSTAVLSSTAPAHSTTPNVVYAATNLATFLASQGRLTAALPIFVSLLRARTSAPAAPSTYTPPQKDSSLTGTLLTLLREPDYPPVASSGDEPLLRHPTDRCEESALKNYIGEILFATASSPAQRQQGLLWVRDGVSMSKLAQTADEIRADDTLRKKCEQCEEVGLEAWGKMMTYLAAEAREERDAVKSGWLKGLLGKIWGKGVETLDADVERFEEEEEGVTLRLNKLRSRMLKEEYAELDRKYARTFVF